MDAQNYSNKVKFKMRLYFFNTISGWVGNVKYIPRIILYFFFIQHKVEKNEEGHTSHLLIVGITIRKHELKSG